MEIKYKNVLIIEKIKLKSAKLFFHFYSVVLDKFSLKYGEYKILFSFILRIQDIILVYIENTIYYSSSY